MTVENTIQLGTPKLQKLRKPKKTSADLPHCSNKPSTNPNIETDESTTTQQPTKPNISTPTD